jgi:hypothetical protein
MQSLTAWQLGVESSFSPYRGLPNDQALSDDQISRHACRRIHGISTRISYHVAMQQIQLNTRGN